MNEHQIIGEIRSAAYNKLYKKDLISFVSMLEDAWYLLEEGYHPYLRSIMDAIPDTYRRLPHTMLTPDIIVNAGNGKAKLPAFIFEWTRHLDLDLLFNHDLFLFESMLDAFAFLKVQHSFGATLNGSNSPNASLFELIELPDCGFHTVMDDYGHYSDGPYCLPITKLTMVSNVGLLETRRLQQRYSSDFIGSFLPVACPLLKEICIPINMLWSFPPYVEVYEDSWGGNSTIDRTGLERFNINGTSRKKLLPDGNVETLPDLNPLGVDIVMTGLDCFSMDRFDTYLERMISSSQASNLRVSQYKVRTDWSLSLEDKAILDSSMNSRRNSNTKIILEQV